MGMKSLLYSLSSFGNTALQRSPLPPGMVPQPTFGLREEELEVGISPHRASRNTVATHFGGLQYDEPAIHSAQAIPRVAAVVTLAKSITYPAWSWLIPVPALREGTSNASACIDDMCVRLGVRITQRAVSLFVTLIMMWLCSWPWSSSRAVYPACGCSTAMIRRRSRCTRSWRTHFASCRFAPLLSHDVHNFVVSCTGPAPNSDLQPQENCEIAVAAQLKYSDEVDSISGKNSASRPWSSALSPNHTKKSRMANHHTLSEGRVPE